jgi:hypothetical protein
MAAPSGDGRHHPVKAPPSRTRESFTADSINIESHHWCQSLWYPLPALKYSDWTRGVDSAVTVFNADQDRSQMAFRPDAEEIGCPNNQP